ncbi:acetyl-CoA carboxylase biotin carboxyl carrier protein [Thioalkalivibrio sp. HK1]|uniref:acetyl-CoA carboxylase biotin carboxyl carrier protein n=1 Tax=Thioalkalivibrio sp. HK1 TaxID=1469245 RepID=UPI00047019C9|nr:acetyl-CoA carboxylase biotin carboxyl carrier protein [Thioalkalivibrio sp. HK1]
MDIRKIKNLIELVEESGIDEIEIREGDGQIRITRRRENPNPPAAPVALHPQASIALPETQKPPSVPVAADSGALSSVPEADDGLPAGHVVTSPMVGTFYQSSSPNDPPFVSVGAQVAQGDTLCIIEAMKILNQIESEVKGKVAAVVAENGHPVEYGQPLFVIATD